MVVVAIVVVVVVVVGGWVGCGEVGYCRRQFRSQRPKIAKS